MNEFKKDEAGSPKKPRRMGEGKGKPSKGKHGKGKLEKRGEKPKKHRKTMADEDKYYEDTQKKIDEWTLKLEGMKTNPLISQKKKDRLAGKIIVF